MPQTKHHWPILLMASLCFQSSRINSPIFNFSFCGTLYTLWRSQVLLLSLFLNVPAICSFCQSLHYPRTAIAVTVDLNYIYFSNWPPATNFSLAPIQICLQSSLIFIIMTPMLKNLQWISLARKKKLRLLKLLSGALNYLYPYLLIVFFHTAYIPNL